MLTVQQGYIWSAISAYHEAVNDTPVRQLPLIYNLPGGVFAANKPARPRYTFIWEVEKVLKYLKQLSPNTNLSNKDLTLKLTMLFPLIAASRCSELKYLSTKFRQNKIKNIYLNFLS